MFKYLNILQQRYFYSTVLLRELVITDFKLRYQNSVLGYFWSALKPLALFFILYIVFVKFLPVGKDIEFFPLYLLLGIVLWNFFAEITNGSVGAIVGRGDLIRKINFPKYVIVLSTTLSALINLLINLVVVAVFAAFMGLKPHWEMLWIIPLIGQLFILALGIGFFLSALYVKFRDTNYVWEVIMQAAFYATPIIYPLSIIPEHYAKIIILSPAAQILQDARYSVVTHQSQTMSTLYGEWWIHALPVLLTFVIFIFGALYFKKNSKNFAEEV